jgi:hypothetical protein
MLTPPRAGSKSFSGAFSTQLSAFSLKTFVRFALFAVKRRLSKRRVSEEGAKATERVWLKAEC